MSFDWRIENKALYRQILKNLHEGGFNIYDGELLQASKKYVSKKKNPYEIVLQFPPRYPHEIIKAYLRSKELVDLCLKRPIKHLAVCGLDLLSVCLKGAWNNLNFTEMRVVEAEVIKWISDYEDGERFPDDFDFPENTFFVPQLENGIGVLIYDFFLNLDIFKDGAYGTYELAVTDCDNIAVMVGLNLIGGKTITLSRSYSLPDKDRLCARLFNSKNIGITKGIWQSAAIPPSPLAIGNKQIDIPLELQEYLWKEITKQPKGNPFILGDKLGYLFFYELFNKFECIFLLVKNSEKIHDAFERFQYLKPFVISEQTLWGRAGGLLDAERFGKPRVAVLGAGAIGSQCAEELVRLGIKNLTLIDKEKLVPENVMRHANDISLVNLNKTDALRIKLEKLNPDVFIVSIPKNVLSEDVDLSKIDSDIFISALADDQVERFVNQVLVKNKKTALYGRTTTTSYGCRIFRVKPHEDACLECLKFMSYFQDIRFIQMKDENLEKKADLVKFKGCTAPSYVGVNLDVELYSNLLTRCAFDSLELGNKKYFESLQPFNHFVYFSRRIDEEADIKPHVLYKNRFLPLAGCPVCGKSDLPYNGILMAESVVNKIRFAAHSSGKKETGGILVGTLLELKELERTVKLLVVTHCTLPGKKAKREPYFFDRDIKYCSRLLKEYHRESKGALNYVGEWHSHPSESVLPSPLDDSSLFKISKDRGYKLDAPLSIIQSNISDNMSFTVYCGDQKYLENPIVAAKDFLSERLGITLMDDMD